MLGGADISSLPDLPNTRLVGDWLMLNPLPTGTYTIDFGGTGHEVVDPVTHTSLLPEGWGARTTDTIVVGHSA